MPQSDTTTKNDLVRLWDEIDSWDDRAELIEFAEELAGVDGEETTKRLDFSKSDPQPASERATPSYSGLATHDDR